MSPPPGATAADPDLLDVYVGALEGTDQALNDALAGLPDLLQGWNAGTGAFGGRIDLDKVVAIDGAVDELSYLDLWVGRVADAFRAPTASARPTAARRCCSLSELQIDAAVPLDDEEVAVLPVGHGPSEARRYRRRRSGARTRTAPPGSRRSSRCGRRRGRRRPPARPRGRGTTARRRRRRWPPPCRDRSGRRRPRSRRPALEEVGQPGEGVVERLVGALQGPDVDVEQVGIGRSGTGRGAHDAPRTLSVISETSVGDGRRGDVLLETDPCRP